METNNGKTKHNKRASNGQYRNGNRCEACGRRTGPEYFSDDRSGRLGVGVCLCEKCAGQLNGLDDHDFLICLRTKR